MSKPTVLDHAAWLLLLQVVVVAACGDEESAGPPQRPMVEPAAQPPIAHPPPAPDAPSPGIPPSQSPTTPLRVFCGSRGTDYAPFRVWNPVEPAPRGFDPALAQALATLMGRQATFVEAQPGMRTPRVEMLTGGLADMVVATFSITPERQQLVDFSRPYYADGPAVLVAKSSPYQRGEELASKRIITVSGTTGAAWVAKNWPGATIVSSLGDAASAVATGRADGYVNDRSHLSTLAKANPEVRVLEGFLSSEPWGIAVSKGNTALLEQINAALGQLDDSGQMAAMRSQWL